ncbi:MAG: amino acid ABC transporter permease [Opitutales bacterium]|nr:amino acid ABC transporter permease [Opitutales bacterium]
MMEHFIQVSNFEKIIPYAKLFGEGFVVTVLLSLLAVMIGFALALVLATLRMSHCYPFLWLARTFPRFFGFLEYTSKGTKRESGFWYRLGRFNPLAFIAATYVEIVRSTPVIVQIFIIYHGVFSLIKLPTGTLFGFIKFHRFLPGVIALGMNSGAYLCEIIRSGIQSVDRGQTEAARSLGLNRSQTFRYVVFPQALKNILPAIANEFVAIIKESAVTYTIGVQDIMSAVNAVRGAAFIVMEPLLVATGLYFCLCFPASKGVAYLEKRMRRGDQR